MVSSVSSSQAVGRALGMVDRRVSFARLGDPAKKSIEDLKTFGSDQHSGTAA
jgi:hypothetical protein